MPTSLRTRLVLLFVVALLANFAATAFHFNQDREKGIRNATADLLAQTRLIGARQQAIRARAETILSDVTLRHPDLHPGDSDKDCASKLAAHIRGEASFDNLAVALPSGELVCSAVPRTGWVNFYDRDYFQRALTTNEIVASGLVQLYGGNEHLIAFAKSMRDDHGHVAAVAILTLDLAWLEQTLASVALPDGGRVMVVDDAGNVAVNLPDGEGYVGRNIAHTNLLKSLRGVPPGAGTFENVGPDGDLRLWASVALVDTASSPLYLALSVPREMVGAPALREAIIYLGVSTGLLLATLSLLLLGAGRFILRPLQALVRTAEQLSTGAIVARSGLPHDKSEFGTLAQALDGAAAAIAEREQWSTEAREQLAASEQRFRRLNELSSDWIWERDEQLRLTYVSPSYVALSGEPNESIVGQSLAEYLKNEDRVLSAQLLAHRPFRDIESARRRPDGTIFWRGLSGEPILDESGNFKGFRGTGRDISERKRHEEELQRQATTDALTGLPNRAVLDDRIEHAIDHANRSQHALAVVMLDLDEFKQINDAVGHEWGDSMLRLVAERLKACVRPEDTVARLGGDEFIVVLEDLADEESVRQVVVRLQEAIAEPAEIQGRVLHTSASIGIAVYPRDGADAAELLRNSDAAMYHAKSLGCGASHFFTQALTERAARHVALRDELEVALERAEFELYYQPIVDCNDGRIVGAEALLRWHCGGTLVAPGEFLDVAEDTGLIVPIGAWALRQACVQAQAWQVAGAASPYVAVNLSAHQFRDRRLFDQVVAALRASALPADRLVLELTESALMRDREAAAATLEEITALGVQLAIDDFGTRYSSLSYLKRFPVSKLKIDQSFVRDAPTDSDDAGIVRAVIELGRALDLCVVAEGVETDEQVALLKALGCDQMQGYRFAHPMPVRDFEALLRLNRVRPKTARSHSIPAVEP